MIKLLKKEFLLCLNAQIVIFTLLAILILIPSWPPAVALLYSLSGLMTLFPRALANKDIEYTVLLPIKKIDVVKGKTLFIMVIEFITILIAVIGGIIRVLNYIPMEGEEAYFEATEPTLSLIGIAFLAYGFMNLIMISLYYKNPYKKLTSPLLISLLVSSLILTIGSLLIAYIEELRVYDLSGLITQILILLFGLILFVLLSYLGYRIGAKKFEKLDL